jgi:hypothetical protein
MKWGFDFVGPIRRKKYKLRNHMTSEVEQLRRRYNQKNHKTLKEGVKKKNQKQFRNKKRWRLFQHHKKKYPRYNI